MKFKLETVESLNEATSLGIMYPFGSSQYDEIYDLAKKYLASGQVKPIKNLEKALERAKTIFIKELAEEKDGLGDEYDMAIDRDIASAKKVKDFKQLLKAMQNASFDFWSAGLIIYPTIFGKTKKSEIMAAAASAAALVASGVYKSINQMARELEFDT